MIDINSIIYWISLGWIILAILLFPILLIVTAPYGRHTQKGWGTMINNKLGWVIMELPSLVFFTWMFLTGDTPKDIIKWILFAAWNLHYINRTFIYPLRTHTSHKKIPLTVVMMAVFFNLVNGTLNGYWLGHLAPAYGNDFLLSPIFIAGLLLFITGFVINQVSDNKLINLRRNNGNSYFIPYGGLFNYISCPNFLGEIIEWAGFALMCGSMPAVSFAVWTFVNLVPRALDHHRWYRSHFEDYPASRKAVFPNIL